MTEAQRFVMKRLPTVERYLKAHSADKGRAGIEPQLRVLPFITISREAGAGGHSLAETLLEVFGREGDTALFGGWQVFDRELCEFVARDPAYAELVSTLLDEEFHTRSHVILHRLLHPRPHDPDQLMQRVFRVVAAVATIGKCIIIGRAGSEVTRDMPEGIAVRLVAPKADCIQGMMDHYGLGEAAEAEAEARRLDRDRGRLLKRHFGVDIDDPTRYDVVWNTGRVSFEEIASSLVPMGRARLVEPTVRTAR